MDHSDRELAEIQRQHREQTYDALPGMYGDQFAELRTRGHDIDLAPDWSEGFVSAAEINEDQGSVEAGPHPTQPTHQPARTTRMDTDQLDPDTARDAWRVTARSARDRIVHGTSGSRSPAPDPYRAGLGRMASATALSVPSTTR